MAKTTLHAPLRIPGSDEHMPVRPLHAALSRVADWPPFSSRTHADLTLYPVHEDDARARCWYELWWTHPTVTHDSHPWDGEWIETDTARIERIALLPAPPVIPLAQRLAQAPPPDTDTSHLSDAELTLWGGADKYRDDRERQHRIAIREDRTVNIYDWDAYAASILDQLTLPARKLTPGQRAAAALARYLTAIRDQDAARASVLAMTANAARAGDTTPLEHLPDILPLLDPTLATEPHLKALTTPPHTDSPRTSGRPSIGPTINTAYPTELLHRIDTAARRANTTRAAWLRDAAAAAVTDSERRADPTPTA